MSGYATDDSRSTGDCEGNLTLDIPDGSMQQIF